MIRAPAGQDVFQMKLFPALRFRSNSSLAWLAEYKIKSRLITRFFDEFCPVISQIIRAHFANRLNDLPFPLAHRYTSSTVRGISMILKYSVRTTDTTLTVRACKGKFPTRASIEDCEIRIRRAIWNGVQHICSQLRSPLFTAVWHAKGTPLVFNWGGPRVVDALRISHLDDIVTQALLSLLNHDSLPVGHANDLCLVYMVSVDNNFDEDEFQAMIDAFTQADPFDPAIEIGNFDIKTCRATLATLELEIRRSLCSILRKRKRLVPGSLAITMLPAGSPGLLNAGDYRLKGSYGHLMLYPFFKEAIDIGLQHNLDFWETEVWCARLRLENCDSGVTLEDMIILWIDLFISDENIFPEPWQCYHFA